MPIWLFDRHARADSTRARACDIFFKAARRARSQSQPEKYHAIDCKMRAQSGEVDTGSPQDCDKPIKSGA
jgi:hypothetical protein